MFGDLVSGVSDTKNLNSWKPRVLLEKCLKITRFFYSFVRSRERLVSEYFLKILWKTRVWRFCWKSLVFHNFAKSREKLMFGYFLEIISGLSLMSHVKSRERLVFGYFSLFCWKSLVFHSFAKSRETLVFERFLEMISGLSQLCKVSWKACVWRFYWNDLWSFETLQSRLKRSCLEIFLKCSLVFRSYVKSRERHVFRDILENLWLFTALVSPKARVCSFLENRWLLTSMGCLVTSLRTKTYFH